MTTIGQRRPFEMVRTNLKNSTNAQQSAVTLEGSMKQNHLKTTAKCLETIGKSLTPFNKQMCLIVRLWDCSCEFQTM